MWMRTDTSLDQECGTEKACGVSVNTVQCRVIVDNMCESQHSSSHGKCAFDARLGSQTQRTDKRTFLQSGEEDPDSLHWQL